MPGWWVWLGGLGGWVLFFIKNNWAVQLFFWKLTFCLVVFVVWVRWLGFGEREIVCSIGKRVLKALF